MRLNGHKHIFTLTSDPRACTCLQGGCGREDCPFLHVNLSPSAPVCQAFVRGYCPAGARCLEKHLTLAMIEELKHVRRHGAASAAAAAAAAAVARKRVGFPSLYVPFYVFMPCITFISFPTVRVDLYAAKACMGQYCSHCQQG